MRNIRGSICLFLSILLLFHTGIPIDGQEIENKDGTSVAAQENEETAEDGGDVSAKPAEDDTVVSETSDPEAETWESVLQEETAQDEESVAVADDLQDVANSVAVAGNAETLPDVMSNYSAPTVEEQVISPAEVPEMDADLTEELRAEQNDNPLWAKNYKQWRSQDLPTTAVIIHIAGTSLLFDPAGGKTKAGTTMQIWSSNNTLNQRFLFSSNGDGTYRIISLKSGLSLGLAKQKVAAGNSLVLATYTGSADQKWKVNYDAASASFKLFPSNKSNLCPGVRETKKGAALVLLKSSSKNLQLSLYTPIAPIPDDTYQVVNKKLKTYVLDLAGRSDKNGANIQLFKNNHSVAQIFQFRWDARVGYYTIQNIFSKKVLDVAKRGTKAKTNIQQWRKNGSNAQYWFLEESNDGAGYAIRYALNGMQLAAVNNKIKNKSNIGIMPATAKENRYWLLRKAAASNSVFNSYAKLEIPTAWYGGAELFQAYHPKAVSFAEPWNEFRYWMAYTPYPYSNSDFEDPCIAASNDLIHWSVPEGLQNPIDDTHLDGSKSMYNSDTHLLYNPDKNRLELFWRHKRYSKTMLYRATSLDGRTWSKKECILTCEKVAEKDALSPVVIYEDGLYRLWYVENKAGKIVYRESRDCLNWTEAGRIIIPYEYAGMKTWHLDIEKTDSGYEALLSAFDQWDNRNRMNLWYSQSKNGITGWRKAKVILRPTTGANRWDSLGIYRSCLMKINNIYLVYYSGTSEGYAHGIGLMYGEDILQLHHINVDFHDVQEAQEFAEELERIVSG